MRWIKKFEAFEINIGDAKLSQIDINKILKGYLECALWTEEERLKEDMPNIDFNEDDNKMDEIEKIIHLNDSLNRKSFDFFTKEDIDVDSLIDAYSDIKKFIEFAGKEAIDYAINERGLERLGHDIWLTRNHHGAGFFDHSYDDDIENKLTQAAYKLKEINLFVGDNYKLYFNKF
jgi:hypothetical protein